MNEILVTENLTKKYSKFIALNNLNLRIQEKTCVGFLGPNGAGKSTTIKILTGLLRPSSGNAYIAGKDVTTDTRLALANVGVVQESPQFIPKLSAQEILFYFGRLRGMSKNDLASKIKDVLELVHLLESSEKKVGTFSKGMNQRLAIASALLHDPSLVILDEPSLGLDPRGIIEIREIIGNLKQHGNRRATRTDPVWRGDRRGERCICFGNVAIGSALHRPGPARYAGAPRRRHRLR